MVVTQRLQPVRAPRAPRHLLRKVLQPSETRRAALPALATKPTKIQILRVCNRLELDLPQDLRRQLFPIVGRLEARRKVRGKSYFH